MRRDLADQLAYGSKCNHLAGRVRELQEELRPRWLSVARAVGFQALVTVYCGVFWLTVFAGILAYIFPLIRGMM